MFRLRRLRHNLGQVAVLAWDALPAWMVCWEGYRSLRRVLSRNPDRYRTQAPAMPFTAEGWRERRLAGPSTDLVIEGFPGSGNSYVSNATRRAVARPANIESHFHYTAQLRRAIAFGVPAIVLVRPPRAACSSLKSKSPETWSWLIVLRWLLFHRYVLRRRDRLAVFSFDDAVADVDLLRRRCAAMAQLTAQPITGEAELRRESTTRVPIDDTSAVVRWLLRCAERLYQRLLEIVRR